MCDFTEKKDWEHWKLSIETCELEFQRYFLYCSKEVQFCPIFHINICLSLICKSVFLSSSLFISKSSGLTEKNTLDIWFNYNCIRTKYLIIFLTTKKVWNGEWLLSNTLITEMLMKKSMDFGNTTLENLDKHRRNISCSHSYYIIKTKH